MKKLLMLFAFAVPCLLAQALTTITGPLNDAAGRPANCTLTFTPQRSISVSPTIIRYIAVSGDIAGNSGGFGSGISDIRSNAALAVRPGRYTLLMACNAEFGSGTFDVRVPPGGSFDLQSILAGRGRSWTQMLTSYSATNGSWSQQ